MACLCPPSKACNILEAIRKLKYSRSADSEESNLTWWLISVGVDIAYVLRSGYSLQSHFPSFVMPYPENLAQPELQEIVTEMISAERRVICVFGEHFDWWP